MNPSVSYTNNDYFMTAVKTDYKTFYHSTVNSTDIVGLTKSMEKNCPPSGKLSTNVANDDDNIVCLMECEFWVISLIVLLLHITLLLPRQGGGICII